MGFQKLYDMHYQRLIMNYGHVKFYPRASLNIRSLYEPQVQQKSRPKKRWEMLD